MSLWLYVVGGLLAVIAIIVLMKTDNAPMRSFKQKTDFITNVTYICMHCGKAFKGAKCPNCGSDRKQTPFGR